MIKRGISVLMKISNKYGGGGARLGVELDLTGGGIIWLAIVGSGLCLGTIRLE